MKRKDKEALGLTPPKISKYAAKRAAQRANPDSPFAPLASLKAGQPS